MKSLGCTLALLVAGSTLLGCNKKVPECNSLVGIINPAVESVNKASNGKSDKGADMAKSLNDVATTLNGTATSLGNLDLTTAELKKFSGDYQKACKDAAVGAGALATLLSSVDAKVKEAETLQKTLDTAMQALVDACGASSASSGCDAVSTKMKEAPSDLAKAADVEKFATDLGQILAVATLAGQVYNDTALSHHKKGEYQRAAELFHKATVADPDNTLAPYNYACALAKLKHAGTEAALKAAIAAGGAKVKAKAAKDSDFADVRGEAWFAALLQ